MCIRDSVYCDYTAFDTKITLGVAFIMEITQKIQGIIKEFGLTGDILSCEHIVNGHINNTYLIKTSDDKKFMVQKINKYVFKNPEAIMHNIDRVTHHIRKKIREEMCIRDSL